MRTASVRLPLAASVGMSRRLFASRIATASSPIAAPDHHAPAGTRLHLDVCAAADRDEAEEDEHHELPQAEPRVRPRPAGIEERRNERRRAHGEDGGRRRDERERQPGERPDREREQRRDQHRPRARPAARREPRRAEALGGVDAANAVEVVVREVDAHLEAQPDRQGRRGPPWDRRGRDRGADDDRDDARSQGSRPGAADPQRRGAHGRFGKREKSGSRFSTNALRPSCASSDM